MEFGSRRGFFGQGLDALRNQSASALPLLVSLPALRRAPCRPGEPTASSAVDSAFRARCITLLLVGGERIYGPSRSLDGRDRQPVPAWTSPGRERARRAALRPSPVVAVPSPPFRLWLRFFLQLSTLQGRERFVPAF